VYDFQSAYDLLDRPTTLTYPDGEAIRYAYNSQGGLETITTRVGDSAPQTIVSDIDYNEAGQILKLAYGNGVVSDYTYNPQTLRLSSLITHRWVAVLLLAAVLSGCGSTPKRGSPPAGGGYYLDDGPGAVTGVGR